MKRRATFPITLLGICLIAAGQQPPGKETGQAEDDNTPGRAVARLSLMNGEVSVRRGDSGDWLAAALNAPLLVEDRVVTGAGSRAEVQFDFYHRLRLAADTEVRLPELEWGRFTIQVARGTVTFSALEGGDAQVEISTPAVSVRPATWGRYRVTVRPDGSSEITVRSGEAEIYTPAGTQKLKPGKTMLVRLGESNRPEFQVTSSIPRDAWDAFNEERDNEIRSAQSYKYVNRSVYGAEELDRNGEWVYAPPYGHVWRPYASAGWAPYRNGRWSWVDYYGWTWVSYDPWGWAPYHWGRWFWWNNSWCWYPGAYTSVSWWRPGLVAWFGWGGAGFNVGIGFGWGRVGWVPLAPFEPCYRWWGSGWYGHGGWYGGRGYHGTTVVNNTHIVNNVNVTNIYRNARVANGITVNDAGDFSRGSPGRAWRNGDGELARTDIARGAAPVAPGRESLRWSDREAPGSVAARQAGSERFYSRRELPRVERASFDQQRSGVVDYVRTVTPARGANSPQGLEAGSGARGAAAFTDSSRGTWRNVDSATPSRGAAGGTATRGTEPMRGAESSRGGDGWRTFGDPGAAGRGASIERSEPAARSESGSRSGWRTFGDPANAGWNNAPGRGESGGTGTPSRGAASGVWESFRGESAGRSAPARTGSGSRSEAMSTDPGTPSRGGGGLWEAFRGDSGARSSAPRTGGGFGRSESSDPGFGAPARTGGGSRGGESVFDSWRSSGGGSASGRGGYDGGRISTGGGMNTPRSDPGYRSGGDVGRSSGGFSRGGGDFGRGSGGFSAPGSMGRGGSIGGAPSGGGFSAPSGGGMRGGGGFSGGAPSHGGAAPSSGGGGSPSRGGGAGGGGGRSSGGGRGR